MPHRRMRSHLAPIPGVPELRLIGHLDTGPSPEYSLPPHRHRWLEVAYLARGNVRWWSDEQWWEVGAADFFVMQPEQPHGGSARSLNSCEMFWIQIDLGRPGALGLPASDLQRLRQRLGGLGRPCFPAETSPRTLFERILSCVDGSEPDLRALTVRTAAVELLLDVVRSSPQTRGRRLSEPVARACSIMDAHLTAPLGLPVIASRAGCATSTLQLKFRRELGVSPAQHYLRRRIAAAAARLEDGDRTITEIAMELGFASSQYFATAFRRVTGLTPSAYRANSGSWGDHPAVVPYAVELSGEITV